MKLWLSDFDSFHVIFFSYQTSEKLQLVGAIDSYTKNQISHLKNRNLTDYCFVQEMFSRVKACSSLMEITCILLSRTPLLYIKSNYSVNYLVYIWTWPYIAWSENWQLVLSETCYQNSSIFGQLHTNLNYTDTGNRELFKLCGNADRIINLWFNAVQSMSYLWLRIVIYFSISNQPDSSNLCFR